MAKVPAFAKAFAGRWRIVEMDDWDNDVPRSRRRGAPLVPGRAGRRDCLRSAEGLSRRPLRLARRFSMCRILVGRTRRQ